MDIKQQFSLGHLLSSRSAGGSADVTAVGAKALDEAVVVYSQPILAALGSAPQREMRVHDLVRTLEERQQALPSFAELLAVLDRLQELNFLSIVQQDPTGNHLIRLVRRA